MTSGACVSLRIEVILLREGEMGRGPGPDRSKGPFNSIA